MSTPYAVQVQQFTARLRARMHRQSYSNTVERMLQSRQGSAAALASARLGELQTLADKHQRTFDPVLKQKALGILHTLPLKATDEDPHFAYTLTALRCCAYFGAVQAPATYNLINHLTRHSFLLDAFNILQITLTLEQLRHPQTREILGLLLPRIAQLTDDFTTSEARLVLRTLATEKMLSVELGEKLTKVMAGSLQDMSTWELANCVGLIPLIPSEAAGRQFLAAGSNRVCQTLHDSIVQRQYYASKYGVWTADGPAKNKSLFKSAESSTEEQMHAYLIDEQRATAALLSHLSSAVVYLRWGPRPMLNALVRTVVAWSEPLSLPSVQEKAAPPSEQLDPSSPSTSSSATATASGSVKTGANGALSKAETREREDYIEALPQLTRRWHCECLKALHYASYRHIPGLRVLSSRIAAHRQADRDTISVLHLQDLAVAIESVAFFYATECIPTVVSLVGEVREGLRASIDLRMAERANAAAASQTSLSSEETVAAEAVAIRTLLSCARLLTAHQEPHARQHHSKVLALDPAMVNELLAHMVALTTSPLVQAYLRAALFMSTRAESRTASSAIRRRYFAGASHLLYVLTVMLQTSAIAGQEAALDAATVATLHGNLKGLVGLVKKLAESEPGDLPAEAARQTHVALATIKEHPEWLQEA